VRLDSRTPLYCEAENKSQMRLHYTPGDVAFRSGTGLPEPPGQRRNQRYVYY